MKRIMVMVALLCVCIHGRSQSNGYNASAARQFDRLYGQVFPAMELELPDSSAFSTSSLADKTVYVDFWFTSCAPCLKEIPWSTKLQQFFASDTNIVFLNICIDNVDRKDAWRRLISTHDMQGIHVFYARNRPQQINLVRQFAITNYPTYLLLHHNRVIGYNAPAPSHKGFVQWAIYQASKGIKLSDAYMAMSKRWPESTAYLAANWPAIEAESTVP